MRLDPFGSIPVRIIQKLNWFEGFRRIKKLVQVAFVLWMLVWGGTMIFEKPYWKVKETTNTEQIIQTLTLQEYSFPLDATEKEITKTLKGMDGQSFFQIFGNLIWMIPAGVIFFEICFWIPVYIARGFVKND